MAERTPVETKNAIMLRIEQGHPISLLAKEYSITPATIYHWQKAKEAKGLHLVPDPKLTPEEQVELITKEYVGRIKAILIKQIQDSIRNLNL